MYDPASGSQGEPYLLYVGNLLPHKNLLRLLVTKEAGDGCEATESYVAAQ